METTSDAFQACTVAPGPGERERSAPRRARAGHTCKSKAGSSVSVRRSSSPQSAAGQTVTTRHAHRSRPLSCPTAVLADLQRCPGHHCRLGPPRRWRVVTIPRTPGPRPESPTRLNSSPHQTAWEAIRRAGTLPVTSFDAGVDLTTIRSPPARHADPRTTMRYDLARKNLHRHPKLHPCRVPGLGT